METRRPHVQYDVHVSLHVKIFDNFIMSCKEVDINDKDAVQTQYLSKKYSDSYKKEQEKETMMDAFKHTLAIL